MASQLENDRFENFAGYLLVCSIAAFVFFILLFGIYEDVRNAKCKQDKTTEMCVKLQLSEMKQCIDNVSEICR